MTKEEEETENTAPTKVTSSSKFNKYATKKTFAQGLLDIGLLMANASQLKSLLSLGPDGQDYYYALLVMIALSIALQVVVGVLLLVLGSMEVRTDEEKKAVHTLNDTATGLIFAITIINVFIAAFGIKLSDDNTK